MTRYYFKFREQNPSDAYRIVTSVGEAIHIDTEDMSDILLQKLFSFIISFYDISLNLKRNINTQK